LHGTPRVRAPARGVQADWGLPGIYPIIGARVFRASSSPVNIRNSIVSRYFLVSLLGAVLPMVVVAALYDRYASALLDQITGERLSAQLTATASRLTAFFDVRVYQIETLSNHPALPYLVQQRTSRSDTELEALLRLEADVPDLYGILLFDPAGALTRIVAGQAASGAPYWSGLSFDLARLPVMKAVSGDVDVVGPVAPDDGSSGWFLIRQPLRRSAIGEESGSIALHVRLASVTELLGSASLAGIVQPVLKTPRGYFNVVGQAVTPSRQMVAGPEVLPGWQPMLVIDPDQLFRPFITAQKSLFLVSLVSIAVITLLFARLAARLRRRVDRLTLGADAVAAGNLDYRIATRGGDEIDAVGAAFNSMAERLQALIARTVRVERLAVLGEFATGVAHEIRNPLATIKTTVQALARGEKDRERGELLQDVGAEIDRLNRVMGDLLEFGRPRPPELAPVPAAGLLARIEALMAAPAHEAGVVLRVDGATDIVLHADRDQLIQVIVNLVINAVQATPAGGSVRVRAIRTGREAGIEVRDTGAGIAEAHLARITDPFFTTKPKGTGLGLSIARQLAELQGGRLEIGSAPGAGTTVRLIVPMEKHEP